MLGIFKSIFGKNDDSHSEDAAKNRLQKLRDRKIVPSAEGEDAANSLRDLVHSKSHDKGSSSFAAWQGLEGKAHSVGLVHKAMITPFKGGAFGYAENPLADDIEQFTKESFAESSAKKKLQFDLSRTVLASLISKHGQIERNLDPELGTGAASGQFDIVKDACLASDWSSADSLFGGTGLFCDNSERLLPAELGAKREEEEEEAEKPKCFGPPVDLNKLQKPKDRQPLRALKDDDFVEEVFFHYDLCESLFDEEEDESEQVAAEPAPVAADKPAPTPTTQSASAAASAKPAAVKAPATAPIKPTQSTTKAQAAKPTPASSVQPAQPTTPAQATKPTQSTTKAQPVKPVQPASPSQTVRAAQPAAAPTQPASPAPATKPSPTQSSTKVQAVKPAASASPAQAAKPTQSTTKAQAVKPAQPASTSAQTPKPSQSTTNAQALKPSQSTTNAQALKPTKPARIEESSGQKPRDTKTNLLLSDLCDSTEIKQFSHPYDKFSESSLKLIAQNPKTPPGALAWLAAHRDPHIRAAVAKNPAAPIETFWVLARDHEASIRYSIAENLYMSPEILRELSRDRNPLIATTAQNSLHSVRASLMNALPPSSLYSKKASATGQSMEAAKAAEPTEAELESGEEEFLLMISRKTTTPARRLKELANHASASIRAAVAENANTPPDVLWLMARDADPNVKIKLAQNCNLPEEILDILKEDKDSFVSKAAQKVQSKLAGLRFSGDAGGNDIRHILTWP